MRNQRKRLWIDSFQTRMIFRILFYCIAYQASLWIILMAVQTYLNSMDMLTGEPMSRHLAWTALLPVLAFLGIITIDAVRFVHRLVGPVYRFRKTIQAITAGEPVDLVQLRERDYLKDVMKDFNEMLQLLEQRGAVVIKDRQLVNETVAVN